MKYTFHDNEIQRETGCPFDVLFSCDEYDGWLSVLSHCAGSEPKFDLWIPNDMTRNELEQLSRELDMHLTGESYCD